MPGDDFIERAPFVLLALGIVLTTAACDSSSSTSPTMTSPNTPGVTSLTPTYIQRLSGIVPAPVDGVPQSDSKTFKVGQGGGTVSVTLTSAVETFPNGTINPAVVMGLAVGAPGPGTCTLSAGQAPSLVQPGATGLSGTLNAGAYCIQISDQTVQQGPVMYTVVIVAP